MTAPGFDILDVLPHRPPFRFITRVLTLTVGESGEAIWSVRGEEPFFAGHFPGEPIVPGVLISEALAQLSGIVGFHRPDQAADTRPSGDGPAKLVQVEIRFHDPVSPPAEIHLQSRLSKVFGQLHQFDVVARVGERKVAKGRLTLAVATPRPEGIG